MNNQLTVVQKHLSRGGALCKEFNRVRLNDDLDWKREQAYALEIIKNSNQLQRCDPSTIGRSLIDLSVMGLSLSPAMKEAYLIPYKQDCTASPSYIGLIQIVLRTGVVYKVETDVVRKNDTFEQWTVSGEKHFSHKVETSGERGEVTHAWVAFHLPNGGVKIEIMDQPALLACRDAAAKKNGGDIPFVWRGPFREQMYKKCVIRRGWNLLPKVRDSRMVAMLEALERTDPMDFGSDRDDKVVAGGAPELIDSSHIELMCDKMREYGIEDKSFMDRQLRGLAQGLALKGNIKQLLIRDFESAMQLLEKGLRQWKERMSSLSEQSGSVQEDTTAQREAT